MVDYHGRGHRHPRSAWYVIVTIAQNRAPTATRLCPTTACSGRNLAALGFAAEAWYVGQTGMGANLVEYQLVRIAKLLRDPEDYDGWKLNQRSPALGDVGTLVDILHAQGLADRYVVECSGPDGTTIWLDDFDAQELEAV